MQYISRLILVVSLLLAAQATVAQPPARQKGNTKKTGKVESTTVTGLSERAKSQYPGTVTPQEVEWKRDIYRELDLEKEQNASLYYPVEPMGESMNLFTFLFKNIVKGDMTAYEYSLDGYESFSDDKVVDPKVMLEDYRIMYDEENGEIIVANSDIPSAEVKSYFIKESYYFDTRTGTYGKRITALCPVLHRNDDEFSTQVIKYPMFWVSYDEIAPLLARQSVMTSSLNNVSSMTLDDYFTKGTYEGCIYKTVNLKNQAIAQYCEDSTAIKKEQDKIEQQLSDFRTNLWNTKTVAEIRQDSIDAAAKAANDSIEAAKAPVEKPKRPTRREQKEKTEKVAPKAEKKSKSEPAKASGAAKVSVRRTRR